MFGIWKFVSSLRVGGHTSLLALISARRYRRLLVNGLGYKSVALQLNHFSCEERRNDIP